MEFPAKGKLEQQFGTKELSAREQQMRNNYALLNINRNDHTYDQSTWRHFKELCFNKIISDDVRRQFDERYNCNQFAKLKVPNSPFMTLKK